MFVLNAIVNVMCPAFKAVAFDLNPSDKNAENKQLFSDSCRVVW